MGCTSGKYQVEMEERQQESATSSHKPLAPKNAVEKACMERSRKALRSLLVSKDRDFLLDSSGRKVKVDNVRGHAVGILFSSQAVPSARVFHRKLQQVYEELNAQGKPFEVIYITNDESEALWTDGLQDMPWLALPFGANETSDMLGAKFQIADLPTLVILDSSGNVATKDGVEVISSLGSRAWPFVDSGALHDNESSDMDNEIHRKAEQSSFEVQGALENHLDSRRHLPVVQMARQH